MRFRALKTHYLGVALAGALLFAATGQARAEETNPCFTGKGSIQEVLDSCASFIASSTDTDKIVAAHANRALGLAAIKDMDGAIAETNEMIRLAPDEPNAYYMRAAAYEAKLDHQKAIADLDQAIKMKPTVGNYYLLRGIVYAKQGDLDRAVVEIGETVKLDANSTIAYSKRADIYRQKKDYDLAAADYGEVIKREVDRAKGYSIAAGSTSSRTTSTRPAQISIPRSRSSKATPRRWSDAAW